MWAEGGRASLRGALDGQKERLCVETGLLDGRRLVIASPSSPQSFFLFSFFKQILPQVCLYKQHRRTPAPRRQQPRGHTSPSRLTPAGRGLYFGVFVGAGHLWEPEPELELELEPWPWTLGSTA